MSLLRALFGSSSPNARPEICSYCPASPKEAQAAGVPLQKAGETVSSMTILVIRACDDAEQIRIPAMTDAIFHCMRPPRCAIPYKLRRMRLKWPLDLFAFRLSTFAFGLFQDRMPVHPPRRPLVGVRDAVDQRLTEWPADDLHRKRQARLAEAHRHGQRRSAGDIERCARLPAIGQLERLRVVDTASRIHRAHRNRYIHFGKDRMKRIRHLSAQAR